MKTVFDQERKLFVEVKNLTKGEVPKLYGLTSYDCALPQGWLDEAAKQLAEKEPLTELDAYSKILWGTVWCYEGESVLFGRPFYMYKELHEVMQGVY